jgi:PAS domain S-box-containing protein
VTTTTGPSDFFGGGGETGALIRAFNWGQTSLGPISAWPQSLKTATALLVHSPVPIVMLWGEEGFMLYNDAYSHFAGARHPNLLGSKVREGWPEVADFNDNVMKVCLAGDTLAYRDQALMLNRNGRPEQVWMNLDYSPVLDESGKPAGVIAIVVETTQRVLADRQLSAAHDRLRNMFEQAPGFMALLDGPEHVFTLANAAYIELVGVRELIGKSIREALPEVEGQGYFQLLDRCYATGKPFFGQSHKVDLKRTSGEIETRFVDFIYQPVQDGNGTTTGIFVQGSDVTERKAVEDELHALNATLEHHVQERTAELHDIQTFYTYSSECHAVLTWRADGEFQYDEINPATLRLYGKAREEVIGRTTNEVLGSEIARELNTYLLESIRDGAQRRYVRKQKNSTLEAIATPIPVETGKPRRLVVTAHDITDQQNLESQLRQAQKMEAVGQLTGGLAHDFNNLLAGIMGSLELLSTKVEQGKISEAERYLSVALNASKRAASLTHRLLAFSRRQTLDAKVVNINRLIAGMAELIRRTVGPQIDVEVVSASDLWMTSVDVGQLESALLNLCINARDAMPSGGRITIETCNRWIDSSTARKHDMTVGQYISMCVSDTGTGMTADVAARAFDPFFTTKPTGMGTGLGLSMVYGFAKQSGGHVRIYSELAQGTMVCVYLPRLKNANSADESFPAPDLTATTTGATGTILVVDDEASLRMIMSDVLIGLGYDVLEAQDGASALRILDSEIRLDLLVTDVGLPGGMNGRQVADAAKVRRPDLKVLFVTGYAENAAIGNGFVGEGMHVLTKPFPIDEFVRRIKSILQ